MMEKLKLSENEIDMVGHIVKEMEQELGTDREAALADMRYQFIDKLCSGTVVKNGESREHRRSVQIDKLLTHKIFAIPIFLAIMLLIFWLTFGLVGAWLSDLLSLGIDSLTQAVDGGLTAVRHQSGGSLPDNRRGVRRSGKRAFLFTDHCGAVFLPLYFGGQRLHGPGGLCYG